MMHPTKEWQDEQIRKLHDMMGDNPAPVESAPDQAENFTDSLRRQIYDGGAYGGRIQNATPIPAQEDVGQYGQGMPIQDATPIPTQKDVGQYSNGMPVQDATPIPEQGDMKSYGPGAAFYPDGSQDYTDPARYYNNDPRFSKSAGKVITTPSLVDPNLGVSDRDPRDYSSAGDPTGVNADRRAMTRDYLSQKYGQAANSDKYDDAVADQSRTNDIADVGHSLDRMFTSRAVAYGGKGADAGFWQGMKRDAAGRTQEAGDARKQKIADYLMKQRMGNEGVAQIDQIRNSDQQAAMYDPNSGVSRATRSGFKQVFPNEAAAYPDLEQMNAIDIERLVKGYEAKAKRDTENTMRTAQAAQWNSDAKLKADMAGTLKNKAEAEVDYLKARAGQANRMPLAKEAAAAKPSPAIQALDRKYVNDYLKWTTEDKGALDRNLELLRQSEAKLQKELNTVGESQSLISGNLVGRLHDSMRSEESKKIQADVEQAALGSIKGTLSGPTSDRDVNIILSKSYDPKLSISSNLDKIRKSIAIIEAAKKEKDKKAAYFEKMGSLGGYQSSPTTDDSQASDAPAQADETKKPFYPMAIPKEGYLWMEDPETGEKGQVPKNRLQYYKQKGLRAI